MAPAAAIEVAAKRGGRAPAAICGARRKQGGGAPCKRGRGWGTDHPGFGNCKVHGGSTPSGKASAAKEAAMQAARADYGGEIEIEPTEALLYTVKRGAHLAAHWQRAALAAETNEAFLEATAQEVKALGDLNHWALSAVRGGVAERQVLIAERLADGMIAAAEEALEALEAMLGAPLTIEQRTVFAGALGNGLGRLESGTIETSARDH